MDCINVKIRDVILSALGETRGRAHATSVNYSLQLHANLQYSKVKSMKNKNQNEEEKPNYVDMEQTAFKMTYQKQE